MKLQKLFGYFGAATAFLTLPKVTLAHEAYVLDKDYFWNGLHSQANFGALRVLKSGQDLHTIAVIGGTVIVFLFLNFLFRRTKLSQRAGRFLERFSKYGPLFVRVTIAVSFLFSAMSGSFLGPELALSGFSHPEIIRVALFGISAMIFFGFLTELAAIVALVFFLSATMTYGAYLATYLNYLGEIFVLIFFGLRAFSVDAYLFGRKKFFPVFEKLRPYETTIVRIFYGLALIYAAITVKFLHPQMTEFVVNHWDLTRFHWLFPSDPLLVVFGAGICEFIIGFFIMIGFELRLTVFVSLFYITLSLIFFRELVWPHLLLYGISLNLIVQPEVFSLDHLIFSHHRRAHKWWKRPFLPHRR